MHMCVQEVFKFVLMKCTESNTTLVHGFIFPKVSNISHLEYAILDTTWFHVSPKYSILYFAVAAELLTLFSQFYLSHYDNHRYTYHAILPIAIFIGKEHCTINVHLLFHLPKYVKRFGPLSTHLAFPFEDTIGTVFKLGHSTPDIEKQMPL